MARRRRFRRARTCRRCPLVPTPPANWPPSRTPSPIRAGYEACFPTSSPSTCRRACTTPWSGSGLPVRAERRREGGVGHRVEALGERPPIVTGDDRSGYLIGRDRRLVVDVEPVL